MTTLGTGAAMAISWRPTTIGGIILSLVLLMAVSWWLTGKIIRERDLISLIFRWAASVLVCICIGLFHVSLMDWIHRGPLASALETQAEKDQRLRENMQQWVAPAACDAYWNPPAADPRKLMQMSTAERAAFEAAQVSPVILVESAVRALVWMALEHRKPSPLGRKAVPHAERGTKVLNDFTVPQVAAMFDYVLTVSPRSESDARPYLADALAYCSEATAPVHPGIAPVHPDPGTAPGAPAVKPEAGLYPFVQASRVTPRGRAFVIRLSATQTRVIEAGSEEEALRIAKQH
jgi:hypothetical protein